MNVCVPPPLAPVTPIRAESTSGNRLNQSNARIELYVCSPIMFCWRTSAWGLK